MPTPVKPVLFETNDRGCHICTSHCTLAGYAVRYKWSGGKRAFILLHREAYEKSKGTIPDGMVVRHKCDTPLCINPDHLELGTHADNMRDRDERGRGPQGSKNGNAVLNEYQARDVRDSVGPLKEAAGKYGISISLVSKIRKRKAWKSLN